MCIYCLFVKISPPPYFFLWSVLFYIYIKSVFKLNMQLNIYFLLVNPINKVGGIKWKTQKRETESLEASHPLRKLSEKMSFDCTSAELYNLFRFIFFAFPQPKTYPRVYFIGYFFDHSSWQIQH